MLRAPQREVGARRLRGDGKLNALLEFFGSLHTGIGRHHGLSRAAEQVEFPAGVEAGFVKRVVSLDAGDLADWQQAVFAQPLPAGRGADADDGIASARDDGA